MTTETIKKLGIIAGGGSLPLMLVDACKKSGVEVFAVGFKGQTDDAVFDVCEHKKAKLGQVGKIIKFFQKNDVTDLVMIGSIQRP